MNGILSLTKKWKRKIYIVINSLVATSIVQVSPWPKVGWLPLCLCALERASRRWIRDTRRLAENRKFHLSWFDICSRHVVEKVWQLTLPFVTSMAVTGASLTVRPRLQLLSVGCATRRRPSRTNLASSWAHSRISTAICHEIQFNISEIIGDI